MMKREWLLAAVTIFVGSFLVFGVQPMVGNTLLPFFGGTAAVWTVCLAAFQTLLLVGYFYADRMKVERMRGPGKLWFHVALLVLAAAWVGIVSWKFRAIAEWAGALPIPALGALVAVAAMVGVPYTLLSANASLVQALAAREAAEGDRNVYKLYAVSNAGSFCGLLVYPLLMEPLTAIATHWMCFAVGVGIYALCVGILVSGMKGGAGQGKGEEESCSLNPDPCSLFAQLEWLGLSALSCFLLNGVSAHLCNDVTPLPLMWAAILALYLLSWILGFTDRGCKASPVIALAALALCGFAVWHCVFSAETGFFVELGAGLGLVLLGGWTVHARLFRLRPNGKLLTRYYLFISLGGAIGGTAASIVCPSVFSSVVEYPAALVLLVIPAFYEVFAGLKQLDAKLKGELKLPDALDWRIVGGCVLVFAAVAWHFFSRTDGRVIFASRNFYGTCRVHAEHMHVEGGTGYDAHVFEHGATRHNMQPTWIGLRDTPTMYFGPHAGGLSIEKHPKRAAGKPMRVALAGMGMATLATYAREGDEYRFYELNPQVAELASNTNYFWYVSNCKGKLDIVVDDARRALERERDSGEEKWDVIIIDVFSGDSIPPHLATKEAFRLYLDRLAPDGILSMHITNWHLALSPMVKAAAKAFDLHLQGFGCFATKWGYGSYWTFFTRENADFFIEGKHGRVDYDGIEDIELMTDEKHSLLPYISANPMPEFK